MSRKYNAIVIDTSIYSKYSYKLESGYFPRLSQFKNFEVNVLIPDVIKDELLSHMSDRVKADHDALSNLIGKMKQNASVDSKKILTLEHLHSSLDSFEEVANERFLSFSRNVGLQVVSCDEYANLSEIMKLYFSKLPPFKNGKKKSEFPDAIALNSIENWAKLNKKKVLAISTDNDWKDYSNETNWIDCCVDLGDAFHSLLNESLPKTLEFLFDNLNEGKAETFISSVKRLAKTEVSSMHPRTRERSKYKYRLFETRCHLNEISFVDNNIEVLSSSDNETVFAMSALLEISTFTDIEFINDPEYKTFYGIEYVEYQADTMLESTVLITISDYVEGVLDTVDVVKVEVLESLELVSLGSISP